ncbi:MAG TPA: glycosyltransferase family 9 protein [Gemmatimonadaceae bacterium]|nr:glycosyltransferase family 9 protein [Gemmatimonadaceae bacterium]
MTGAPRILVSRTDGIGDVALTLPLCGLLRARLGAEVVLLCRGYARPVAEASPEVDAVVEWDADCERDPAVARARLAGVGAQAIVHAFPRPAVARAARAARIPRRIGTSHRWYHWLTCTDRVAFSRKRSDLHEAQLNVRLAEPLLGGSVPALEELVPYGRLVPSIVPPAEVEELIAADLVNVVLHPKSHGSAREWPLERWSALVEALDPTRYRVFVTGSAAERDLLRDWVRALPSHAVDLTGRLGLAELIGFLARVDGVIAASTGPLHLGAQLGRHALGLFSPTRPVHPGRWAPLGPRAEVLVADASCAACAKGEKPCTCLLDITVDAVRERVERWRTFE